MWINPCAQVIFDSDPAPKDASGAAALEMMSQAMIRSVQPCMLPVFLTRCRVENAFIWGGGATQPKIHNCCFGFFKIKKTCLSKQLAPS